MASVDAMAVGVGVGSKPAPAYWIHRVKSKLASGEYATEEVPCFCGATESYPIVSRDRYGIPHQMVLCKECSLIYANPRMTKASYERFYNEEYRAIYDGWEQITDKEEAFACGLGAGYSIYDFISHFDIHPSVVFEIGCNMGSWLTAFKEEGAQVIGVDWGRENISFGHDKGIDVFPGGVDYLIATGQKADLIILNHVLEHFLDFEEELTKIRSLLNPGGYLYIGVPGLYSTELPLLFQNAHTYQFYSDSLSYLMNCSGFEEYYMDEHIASLWVLRETPMSKQFKPDKKVRDIYDYFFTDQKRIPSIRTVNKFTYRERKENIDGVLSCRFPDINELIGSHAGQEAVILCGGPSIDEFVEKIRAMQASGCLILAIERMYQWCTKHDITPDYVVVLDACDDVNESLSELNPQTTHLLATQCQPSAAKLLVGSKAYVFSAPQRGVDQHDYWHKNGYDRVTLINGGGSVSLQSMAIAMTLGMKTLHIFGFDCHVTQKPYAEGISGVGVHAASFAVDIHGQIFHTLASYMSFAQQFFHLMDMAKRSDMLNSVKVYGDSLVNAMSVEDIRG